MVAAVTTGYAPVSGTDMYFESRGEGGVPLVLVHGGYGLVTEFDDLVGELAADRQVLAVELPGHGHTRASGRPFSFTGLGNDLAEFVRHLGLAPADLLGYSLGGQASLRCAIAHPETVRRLVLVSVPVRRDGWFPEVRAAFDQMSRAGFDQLRQSGRYAEWESVAPDPGSFPALMDATGELVRQPYDWAAEVRELALPVQLVYGDADAIPPAHAAEFFALLGGGLRDAGLDGSGSPASQLAIMPGQTHYDVLSAPGLAGLVRRFLG